MKSVFLLVVMIGMSNPTKISNDTHYNNISECIHVAKVNRVRIHLHQ